MCGCNEKMLRQRYLEPFAYVIDSPRESPPKPELQPAPPGWDLLDSALEREQKKNNIVFRHEV